MSEISEMNRTLGIILAKVEYLEKTVPEIVSVTDQLKDSVTSLERDWRTAKPFIDKAKQWEQRGIGAGIVLSALGMIFGGVIVGFWNRILVSLGLH